MKTLPRKHLFAALTTLIFSLGGCGDSGVNNGSDSPSATTPSGWDGSQDLSTSIWQIEEIKE
ncbi:MAG: hypothetical protein OXT67_08985 [Zetaproteobacteria bacterium]|nr:hypothetical protein [Zetaproteobacteria bacterium]